MLDSEFEDLVPGITELSNAELDAKLEDAVGKHEASETLICCCLSEVRERRSYIHFGFDSIFDYAYERFGFKRRKTRYLISLGRKLQRLPRIREAFKAGKIGWCKAQRIANRASRQDETLWLDSALSLSVRELDKRLRDGTDELTSVVHFVLTSDQRVLWENALEICRRVAGAEISPVEAFQYCIAEFIATWGHEIPGDDEAEESESAEEGQAQPQREEPREPEQASAEQAPESCSTVFPFARKTPLDEGALGPEPLVSPDTEQRIQDPVKQDYDAIRIAVLERDGWKCTYPGCHVRQGLHVHHLEFRSLLGSDEPWNLTVLCHFHHQLVHSHMISVKGRAPHALEWTPPKLMQAVLERRRNRPAVWIGELEVRQWQSEPLARPP